MRRRFDATLAGSGAIAALLMASGPAAAHAFGQKYDLPLPLWLYLTGAGAVVALSLLMMVLFVRATPGPGGYPRFNLLRWPIGRLLAHPVLLTGIRLFAVAVLVLIIAAGFIGSQSPTRNIGPTLVWVIWWVGMAFVSALIGDLWALLNPWKTLFTWAEALWRRRRPGARLSLGLACPRRLGAWPAVVFFLVFAWTELIWSGGETPAILAWLIVAYSLTTWLGMFAFGREEWLRSGEVFTIAFGLLARFAPLELRVTDRGTCGACRAPACGPRATECVNCYACFERAAPTAREWNLRPYAVGLVSDVPLPPSMTMFVLLMLATVSFDGFVETPAWTGILDWIVSSTFLRPALLALRAAGFDLLALIKTIALVSAPLLFLAAYLAFSWLMRVALSRSEATDGAGYSTGELCRLFVLSLVPIAIAYHLAHYLSFLLLAGQLVIPLASDPFGLGWNLFGTLNYRIDISVVSARLVWYTAVVAVVLGHVLAVYIAHVAALRALGDAPAALRSQYPLLVLMVGYTMTSLWILAQPVVVTG